MTTWLATTTLVAVLYQAGNFHYNDIKYESKIIHDLSNSPNRLVKGLVNCGIVVGIGAAVAVRFVYGGPAVDEVEIWEALQYAKIALPSSVALGIIYPGFDDLAQTGIDTAKDFFGGCYSAIVG